MSLANTLAYYEIATITTIENYSKDPRGHATNPKGGGSRLAAASTMREKITNRVFLIHF